MKPKTSPTAQPKTKNPKPSNQEPSPPDQIHHIPHATILVTEGFNVRTDFGESLAESIAVHGIRQPLLCYLNAEGQPVLVDGERRLRGVMELEASPSLDAPTLVPVRFIASLADENARTIAMLECGTQGKPLTMSERARACRRLDQLGVSMTDIARAGGVSRPAVKDCLELLETVAPELLSAVDAGRASATMALELARTVPDKTEQLLHFRAGEILAGPDGRVTAKHLPIAIGRAAQGCLVTGVPFADVTEDDSTDSEGRIWKCEETIVPMPEDCRAKVTLLLAFRADIWRYGHELKWPGARKGDGWQKVHPNITGPGQKKHDHALLDCAQSARGELEAKDFQGGDKEAAVNALDDFITVLADRRRAEGEPMQEGKAEASGVSGHQSDEGSAPSGTDDPSDAPDPSEASDADLHASGNFPPAAPLGTGSELLDSVVLLNAPADEADAERLITVQIIADLLAGRLGTPQSARQMLVNWIMGVHQTRAELEDAA